MFKQFIKDSAIYGVTNILANGISYLLIPIYTRALTPADFGVYDIVITLITIVSFIFPLEVSQGIFRYLPGVVSKEEKSDYISSAFWLVTMTYLVFIALFLPLNQKISILLFGTGSETTIIIVAIMAIIFYWLNNLGNLTLRSLHRTIDFSIISLAQTVVTVIFTIFFVLVLKTGALGIILGYFSGFLVAALLSFLSIKNYIVAKINVKSLKYMLFYSIPLIPSSIGSISTVYITRLMINALININKVGIYGVAYKLITPISLVINIGGMTLGQLVYKNYRSKQAPAEIANIINFFTSISLLITAVISIFSTEIIRLMTTTAYSSAAVILPIMALSAFINGLTQFTFGLNIAKKTSLIAIINISTGLGNIGLNFLLIPYLGLIGACIATFISVLINFLISMSLSQKNYFIPFAWRKITITFIILIVFIIDSLSLNQMGILPIIFKGLMILILIITIFLFKTITKKDLSLLSPGNIINSIKLRVHKNPY